VKVVQARVFKIQVMLSEIDIIVTDLFKILNIYFIYNFQGCNHIGWSQMFITGEENPTLG